MRDFKKKDFRIIQRILWMIEFIPFIASDHNFSTIPFYSVLPNSEIEDEWKKTVSELRGSSAWWMTTC